ncbi:response regulator, partial [Acinetobacter baumannii]
SGLEVQEALAGRGIPIVFLGGRADVATAVRAMKAGAIDFLPKPFDTEALLEAVERGLARRRSHEHDAALRHAYSTLTCR